MDRPNRPWPLQIVAGIWRALDRLRRLLHLILLLAVFLLLLVATIGERVYIPGAAALVIAPQGVLVDQLSGDPLERITDSLTITAVVERGRWHERSALMTRP